MICFKLLIWIAFHLSLVQCNSTDFDEWKSKYPNGYKQSTSIKSAAAAQQTYDANQKIVEDHNKNASAPYVMSVNDNSAMTPAERAKFRKGYYTKNDTNSNKNASSMNSSDISKGMRKKASKDQTSKATSSSIISSKGSQKPETKSTMSTKKTTTKSTMSTKKTTTKTSTTTKKRKQKREAIFEEHHRIKREVIPTTYDLSNGLPVKNQYNCAASWAFAAVSLIEYQSIVNGTNLILSVQNMIDCDASSNGCSSGNPFDGLLYSLSAGITTNQSYPYVALSQTCGLKSSMPLTFPNYVCYQNLQGNETLLMLQLVRFGPIATAISTNNTGFDFYSSGVFSDPNCSSDPTKADLAVVVVGYGTDSTTGLAYWLVKVAWGPNFGINGYVKMKRNTGNSCGIANFVSFLCPA